MKARWSSRQRWWLLAAGWLGLLVLGISGFIQQSNELDLGTDFLDHLYFTLQLAALDYKGASQAINWRLQVVRFVAPLMSATTLAQSASVVFRDQFTRWRASRASGHTVVCGLDPVGSGLLESLVEAGRNVVAVDVSAGSPGVAVAGRLGVPVIVGDPTDRTVLLAARVDRADRVVAITPNDAVNVAITSAVRDIDRPGGRPPLRCSVRLSDGGIAHLLRSTELGGRDDVRVSYFNVHERAAHALISAHPVATAEQQSDPVHMESVHLMVAGLGQFGCNVVVGAAQRWMELGTGPLRMTLIDRRASGRLRALTMQHPALASSLDATCVDLDLEAPSSGALDELDAAIAARPPTLVIVAFENDALAWTSSLFVRRRVPGTVDIVVRTDSDGGFGHHLQSNVERSAAIGRIVSFPFVAAACSVELIEGGVREQLARSIHDDHIAHAGTGARLHRGWHELGDRERESSRAAADALVERLAAIGAELVPLQQWVTGDESFSAEELDLLAADEHQRWKAEREADGWTWGAERDDAKRLNPLLLDWDELPDDARHQNRRAVAALPQMLARAGFEIARP